MRIRELHLKNYRPFKEAKIGFSDQFTVIAGINGKGKTAILEALALLISRLLPQISPAKGGYRSFSTADIHADEGRTLLTLKANCAGIPLEFSGSFSRHSRRQKFPTLSTQVQRSIRTAYGNDTTRSGDAAPIAVYYTTDRAGFSQPRTLGTAPTNQASAYHRALVKKKVDFKDFMLWYRVFLSNLKTKPPNWTLKDERTIRMIDRVLAAFLGDFNELRVEENPPRLIVNKAGIPLDLGQISDGERSFLAMITDLCKRLCRANPQIDPLTGEGVVIIDELELHLHPSWQRQVIEKLRGTFPKIQFIATTHSPFVIQSLKPGELINLDPEEFPSEYADKSIEDISETVMGVEVPQKSERFVKMMDAAEQYFKLLRNPAARSLQQAEQTKQTLNELVAPFSDDPAFQAFLKVEREAAGLND
jgi:predicted ATP-binding protein involved in virulence